MREIETMKDVVMDILKKDPKSRDCDKRMLTALAMRNFNLREVCNNDGVLMERVIGIFMKLPSGSAIRARTHIQCELGMYLPSPEVAKRRGQRFEEIKANIHTL